MKIGYARVSTDEQNLALQFDALKRAGCSKIYDDQGVSGTRFSRPGLDTVLARLKPGDTLVVWRLDRLGRSMPKLIDLIGHLERRSIHFQSITEAIATDSCGGVLMFHMMAALAQFERSLISERTRAGMAAARSRGQKLGRKPALNSSQQSLAIEMMKTQSTSNVADHFGIHPRTLRRLQLARQI